MKLTVVSGGQTGVDRAAWDAAIELGFDQKGWVPRGRLAEDGRISDEYRCEETESRDYAVRTERNVIESDATLVLSFGPPRGGTALTLDLCRRHRRPHLHVDLDGEDIRAAFSRASEYLESEVPQSLNVAGPRGSSRPDVYEASLSFMKKLLKGLSEREKT